MTGLDSDRTDEFVEGCSTDLRGPLILLGAPRSGTTYLQHLLNKHPDVYVSPESRLFVWAHRAWKVLCEDEENLMNGRLIFSQYLGEVLPDMLRQYYRRRGGNVAIWGDKNPHYAQDSGYLNTILELYPDAKFIHLIRDGRDVVASLMRKTNSTGSPWAGFEQAHRVWTGHLDNGRRFGRCLPASQYMEVRYEDLVADDLSVAERILDFLGLPASPEIRRFCEQQTAHRTPLSGPTRALDLGATRSDWSRVLTLQQQVASLDMLRDHLVELGYEKREALQYRRYATRVAQVVCRHIDADKSVRGVALEEPSTVIVASKGDDLLLNLGPHSGVHFPLSPDGDPAGYHPATTREITEGIEALRGSGSDYFLIPGATLWWLQHYEGLRPYLTRNFKTLHCDMDFALYRL